MEKNEDNAVIQKIDSKTQSMKMQDFFKLFDLKTLKDNDKKQDEGKTENEKVEKIVPFQSYSSTEKPSININIQKIESIKNNELSNNNIININQFVGFDENLNIFIDELNKRNTKLVIQNYECKFYFDDKVLPELDKLIHFSQKYFEFPIFYAYKGKYDEETHVTTIKLKDYRTFKIQSENNKVYKKIFESFNNKVDFYRYARYYKEVQVKKNFKYEKDGWNIYNPFNEYTRQGVEFSDDKFCLSSINNNYELCETYPNILVIPTQFSNNELFQISKYRMKNRIPLLSYYYNGLSKKGSKSYLYRSAQIKTNGIIFKSKNLEVEYINKIMNMENNNNGFIIFDCRSELNARANVLKGGGIEDKSHYNNCQKIIFGAMENVHNVRKSLKSALQKAYYGKESNVEGKISFDIKNSNMTNFLSKFESTKWLEYLSIIIKGSILVSKYLKKNINVLVHCSDGWDRTAQVCCLVQMILDPYYRTIEGFAVLVEKEWVSFGHKFASRNGCETKKEKQRDRSPIFIQFLHAVYQLTEQYPTAFEFNNHFLLFLCKEIYSNKYGNFLFNCEKEKVMHKATETMISIWSDVFHNKNKYINDLYIPIYGNLHIKGDIKYLNIWNDFFFRFDKIGMSKKNKIFLNKEEYISQVQEDKNKSIIELLNVIKNNGLENLIKDNKIYKLYKDNLDKNE